MVRTGVLGVLVSSMCLLSGAAAAQKSADRLRFSASEPFPTLSIYHHPHPEHRFVTGSIFQNLLAYDERKQQFVPIAAKSWTRVDDRTVDLELYDDIVFHSGNKLTADDVVYILRYGADPNEKFQFKERHTWVESAEKLGEYKVRVRAKQVNATDLLHFSFRTHIYDAKVLASHSDSTDYGRRTPVGSGPYKVTRFDRNAGVTLERYDRYKANPYETAKVGNMQVTFNPDSQTRIAQLLTNNVDLIYNVEQENAKDLAQRPGVAVSAKDNLYFIWMILDTIGRSGVPYFKDERVRKAVFMAIDRDALIKNIIPGGEVATKLNALCFDAMAACAYSTRPPAPDIEGAKKLLAEAGYPNGFEMTLDAQSLVRNVAEAISGMLLKVGIRATVVSNDNPVMFKRWQGGEMNALVNNAPATSWPDGSYMLEINVGSEARDYFRDPLVQKAFADGFKVHDFEARRKIYGPAFDRMNQAYSHLPISSFPTVWGHSKDVGFAANPLSETRVQISDLIWK